MLSAMDQHKFVWQSDLPHEIRLERYDTLVVGKGIWGLCALPALPTDFYYLKYIDGLPEAHPRCPRGIH